MQVLIFIARFLKFWITEFATVKADMVPAKYISEKNRKSKSYLIFKCHQQFRKETETALETINDA